MAKAAHAGKTFPSRVVVESLLDDERASALLTPARYFRYILTLL